MSKDHSALFGLDGKVALVNGASSGLGLHFAGVLARAGATVVLAARRRGRVAEAANALGGLGGRAIPVAVDVTSAIIVGACFDAILATVGVPDVIVNNAGVTVTKPLLQQNESDWDEVMGTNLKGTWLVATEAARRLVSAGRPGCVVNVCSILGERVAGGVAPYAI